MVGSDTRIQPGIRDSWITAVSAAILFAIVAPSHPVVAETRLQTEIENMAVMQWTGSEMAAVGTSRGTVDLRSAPAPMVQARLQLRLTLLDEAGMAAALPEVPRASIRFRFPVTDDYMIRLTSGRDRLSWGIGSLYKAGDLLFGVDGSTTADLTAVDDVRDETAWLLSLYFPLGDMGYIETVALPPLPSSGLLAELDQDETTWAPEQSAETPTVAKTRAGIRMHSTLGPISLEPSYLYDGRDNRHRAAFSIQGTGFGADLYASAALWLPTDPDAIPEAEQLLQDHSRITAGVFRTFTVGYDQTLNARLEALIHPGGEWKNQHSPATEYALQLHPELVWLPERTVSVIARGRISAIDASSEITAGLSWNIFQGFDAMSFATIHLGDETAVYSFDSPGSFALAAGFRYGF